jgi:hypothetical protein
MSTQRPPEKRKTKVAEGCATRMNSKEKAILDRIKHLEDAIAKGREFLESGKHADWHGFRPMFVDKGVPPHRDWVKNVFLPRHEKLLSEAHKALERLTLVGKNRRTNRLQRTGR